MSTIESALSARSDSCGYTVSTGIASAAKKSRVNADERLVQRASNLREGDVMIWIGVHAQDYFMRVTGHMLAQRGVYLISYQTEPFNIQTYQGVDEYWEYSHGNHAEVDKARFVRIVPPGYVQRFPAPPTHAGPVRTLTWLGGDRCVELLPERIRALVQQRYNVWTSEEWKAVAAENHTAFLTMHKKCGDGTMPLESFRLSSILSFGGVIVAEPSDRSDAKMYQNIVLFEPNFYGTEWSNSATRLLFDDPEALATFRERAFELYKKRFDPVAIAVRADIWNRRERPRTRSCLLLPVLNLCAGHPPPGYNEGGDQVVFAHHTAHESDIMEAAASFFHGHVVGSSGYVFEGGYLILGCDGPNATISEIQFASWGTPTYNRSTSTFSIGVCHAKVSRYRLKQECIGVARCEIVASTSFFRTDPCVHMPKALAVNATCTNVSSHGDTRRGS